MSFRTIIRPTKTKVKVFFLFLLGIFVFRLITFALKFILVRKMGVEWYSKFITGYWGLSVYGVIFGLLYLFWIYILIGLIYETAKRSSRQ
jgi:hypothetical protein